jgi:phosphoenolpyruvate carboxylase
MLQVWLGIGDALAEAVEQGKLPLLQAVLHCFQAFKPHLHSATRTPLTHTFCFFVCCCAQVWLGIGDALAEAVEQGKLPLLQAMYDEWPFFRGLLDLVEMVMAKADPRVTAMYDAKLVRPELQVGAVDNCVLFNEYAMLCHP